MFWLGPAVRDGPSRGRPTSALQSQRLVLFYLSSIIRDGYDQLVYLTTIERPDLLEVMKAWPSLRINRRPAMAALLHTR